jgi:hypothetical protein
MLLSWLLQVLTASNAVVEAGLVSLSFVRLQESGFIPVSETA